MLDRLVWQEDRMLLDDLVFRLEPRSEDQWELGEDCFLFYKTEPIINLYARFFNSKEGFCLRNIFELGIWDGGSAVFWNELFHPQKLVAIDLQKREDSDYFRRYITSRGLEEKIKTYWGTNQADAARLRQIAAAEFQGPLNLVIDDASHLYAPTKASFETLFPLLRPGGLYIIEDWAWAYRKEFQEPDHIWVEEIPLTKLIIELVQATGGPFALIPSLSVNAGFVAIERGGIDSAQLDGLKLEQYISLREQDKVDQALSQRLQEQQQELVRQQLELEKQSAELAKLQQEALKWREELDRVRGSRASLREELDRVRGSRASLREELAWRQDQLERMRATRWWRLGTLYWRTHAKVKTLFRR